MTTKLRPSQIRDYNLITDELKKQNVKTEILISILDNGDWK